MSEFETDLFVIGAGSGGVRAARIASGYGAKVMIAEEFRIGGTCVIRGCVPKKLYVYASRFADDFADAQGFGWRFTHRPEFDWPKLVAAKEGEISRLSRIYEANLLKSSVDIFQERAEILGPHEVRLMQSGRVVAARHILVATGASPQMLPTIPGVEHAISSNEIFDLPKFPRRLAVVGGGYIAVEFASIFARLGAHVTLLFRADNVLRGFDETLRDGLRDALAEAEVDQRFGVLPTEIVKTDDGFDLGLTDHSRLHVDQVLIATGRAPHTKGLGLEKAGVEMDDIGAIKVDARNTTNVPSIHAVGDVTNRVNLTPVAIREGHFFADRMFGGADKEVDYDFIPSAVFTTPEIGTVGLTEAEARKSRDCVDIYQTSFRPMKTTIAGGNEKVIMKLVVCGESDQVLGVHILGESAGEMAQLLAISLRLGATKADFDATMALHPSAAEELVTLRNRTARHTRDEE
ncbi:glutathione-disulfide reductase [Rhodoblastus acidophilus]|uniref:Glutathione-disulfide reductase n=1 Tax=Candidatus Rhodoblastus alkanivorans TaxID=2954117 RepID=A0ABS9Z4E7_9HYPH|nr:glutathione-disulfide reductase [Candidatus Rhodoblastus alkanivorans]MCI4680636.1 glutathione-disulfide reductase [Candidatus Rhodoblastus alkanivorans]MCI4682508.1 glutathione-disulfide reductase [Candidatus Rhodoblastus alkanivorans]MDI4639814.1 glutathione-disulfide reductase [Rhodoblastus acidophilus]